MPKSGPPKQSADERQLQEWRDRVGSALTYNRRRQDEKEQEEQQAKEEAIDRILECVRAFKRTAPDLPPTTREKHRYRDAVAIKRTLALAKGDRRDLAILAIKEVYGDQSRPPRLSATEADVERLMHVLAFLQVFEGYVRGVIGDPFLDLLADGPSKKPDLGALASALNMNAPEARRRRLVAALVWEFAQFRNESVAEAKIGNTDTPKRTPPIPNRRHDPDRGR